MKRVVHLIPYDTIGGVETAARSVPPRWHGAVGDIALSRIYLVTRDPQAAIKTDRHGPKISENAPRAHLQLWRTLRAARPDLVVGSLWRCLPVYLAQAAISRRTRYVLFLHMATASHRIDAWLNRLAMSVSDEIWADSNATLAARVPDRLRHKGRVLSFLTDRMPRATEFSVPGDAPGFVFWGRLQPQKNLERALDLFSAVHSVLPGARFTIAGPDRGERATVEARVAALGLGDSVALVGPQDHDMLAGLARDHHFYLQTSRAEGRAMSVVEAMAMGLVPVVTPMGEIANYAHDGEDALLADPDDASADRAVAERIVAVCRDSQRYSEMSAAAAAVWDGAPLYRDDFMSACDDALAKVSG